MDLLINSNQKRVITFYKKSCPNDTNSLQREQDKTEKFAEVLYTLNAGRKAYLLRIIVGTRDYIISNWFHLFSSPLALIDRSLKLLRDRLSHESICYSYAIWLNRFNRNVDKRTITLFNVSKNLFYNDTACDDTQLSLPAVSSFHYLPLNPTKKPPSFAQQSLSHHGVASLGLQLPKKVEEKSHH